MDVKVISVREQNTLNRAGQVAKAIVLTYTVGTQGPFTLVTDQAAINSGMAAMQMQTFAATLNTLPGMQG